jgi:hypothetical protein
MANKNKGSWDGIGVLVWIQIFLWIAIPLSLAWIIYCLYLKKISYAWAPLVLLISLASWFGYVYISQALEERARAKENAAWLANTENKHFSSERLGLSFDYISVRRFYQDAVTVEEKGDVVRVLLGDDKKESGVLQVFAKEPNSTLLSFLQNKYAKDFPTCRFVSFKDAEYARFQSDYEVVIVHDENGCPNLNIKGGSQDGTLLVMNTKHPQKYVSVLRGAEADSIQAFKPTETNQFPIRWYESIVIN